MENNFAHKTIFMVDDEPEILDVLQEIILLHVNINIQKFSSPMKLLEKVQEGHVPNLFITDLRMPDMDGIEFLRQIRTLKIEKPAMILSGNADKHDVVKSLKLGVCSLLEKPVSVECLVEEVIQSLVKEELYSIFENMIEKKDDLIAILNQFIQQTQDRMAFAEDIILENKLIALEHKNVLKNFLNHIKKTSEINRIVSNTQKIISELILKKQNLLTQYTF